jgi:hypothetical protein
MHTQTEEYVAEVTTASTVDEVTALMTPYAETIEHELGEFMHALEDVESCSMGADGMGMADDARGAGALLQDAIDGLVSVHAGHTDVADCALAAASHEEAMDVHYDGLSAHHDHWHDMGMTCQGHEDDEEEHVD